MKTLVRHAIYTQRHAFCDNITDHALRVSHCRSINLNIELRALARVSLELVLRKEIFRS